EKLTPEEYMTWQAYDLYVVCLRYEADPREYGDISELVEDLIRLRAKESLKIKRITESTHGR
ncbi:unnamed protein product, partial [marine sediment metagenome]